MIQLITPTPMIPATGGWCLQYVRQAFGLPAKYASATEAWEKSTSQHRDRNFPAGMWTPVWYGIDVEPLGHVVLRAPNGNVYSTSDYSGWPRLHTDLADLEAFYAAYGMKLQYRGWTEDVASYTVMVNEVLAPQGTTTPLAQGLFVTLTRAQELLILDRVTKYIDSPISQVDEKVWATPVKRTGGNVSALQELANANTRAAALQGQVAGLVQALEQLAKAPTTPVNLQAVTEAANAGARQALSGLTAEATVTLKQEVAQ